MRQSVTESSNGTFFIQFSYFLSIPANKFMEHFSKFQENLGKHSDATLEFGKEMGQIDSNDKSQTKDDADEKTECLFPCLMVTCGSGCPIIKVSSHTGRAEGNDP